MLYEGTGHDPGLMSFRSDGPLVGAYPHVGGRETWALRGLMGPMKATKRRRSPSIDSMLDTLAPWQKPLGDQIEDDEYKNLPDLYNYNQVRDNHQREPQDTGYNPTAVPRRLQHLMPSMYSRDSHGHIPSIRTLIDTYPEVMDVLHNRFWPSVGLSNLDDTVLRSMYNRQKKAEHHRRYSSSSTTTSTATTPSYSSSHV